MNDKERLVWDFKQEANAARELAVDRVRGMINLGIPMDIDIRTSIIVPAGTSAALPVAAPHDIPDNTVTTAYHDEVVGEWQKLNAKNQAAYAELATEHEEWGSKNDRLEAKRGELQDAVSKQKALIGTHIDLGKQQATYIAQLEDKVAGYELGMGKVEVEKEIAKPTKKKGKGKTVKGTPRMYAKKLTEQQVWAIRRWAREGKSNSWISHEGSHLISTVSKVLRGETYATVPMEPPVKVRAGHGVEA